ncbi:MAG: TonB-dependent receptor [Sphingomonadaceae bacterium]|nr:TonB-dependent receptor [Sphingomonadaceae bacterium]
MVWNGAAWAQDPAITEPLLAEEAAAGDAPVEEEYHEPPEAQIVVRAPFIAELNILTGASTLSGTELLDSVRPQIGDTLTRLPGVSATSFGPGASRPVLRGLSGTRVRVLTDGIGSIDVSNTSADHAVAIDPLTAERIEVLRGPPALLYGSDAIGGAVNIIDRRIPRAMPEENIHGDVTAIYGSAADERGAGAAIDIPLGTTGFVFHADGSYGNTDDLEVGGFVASPLLRAELLADAAEERAEGHVDEAEELEEFAALRGRLPNSFTETESAALGLAFIRDRNAFGFSVSHYGSDYGIPARPGAGHAHGEGDAEEEAPVSIGLEQFRFDSRGAVRVNGVAIERVQFRFGFADYEHTEFEGEEVGTVFGSQGMEFRLELQTVDWGGWSLSYGGQFYARDLTAVGAEAFVPNNSTENYSLFAFFERAGDYLTFQGAARAEFSGVDAAFAGAGRSFTSLSGALGATYELDSGLQFGANLSRAERAPTPEELYSFGPHIATQAFEIGDIGLDTEKSIGFEAFLRGRAGPVTFGATAFANWYSDYIFDTEIGSEIDGLPVFQYFQTDARYLGFEAEVSARVWEEGDNVVMVEALADFVRATLEGGEPVPRIPPLRILAGVEGRTARLQGRLEAEWVDDQERVATFESPTDGHIMVNASVSWRPFGRDDDTTLVASANNIFDVDARRHASLTNPFVPLAGRDFRLSGRFHF